MSYISKVYLLSAGTFIALSIVMIRNRGLPDRLMTVWGIAAMIMISIPTIWAWGGGL